MSSVAVIGIGYVGLVTAVCFAEMGHTVICIDVDKEKISALQQQKIPIYEIGLDELLKKNASRITFTTDYSVLSTTPDAVFIAVGTPQQEDGSAYLEYFFKAAEQVADHITQYTLIVNKSTVPIGTSQKVRKLVSERLALKNKTFDFDVVSNPEFLREGTSIYDFMHPDRIIAGTASQKAFECISVIYKPLTDQGYEIVSCDNTTAETIKYAANAFLAVKISFINEISALCDCIHADVSKVAYGIGKDPRIGTAFLQAGPGYGGSCFPKDTRALCSIACEQNVELSLVRSAIQVNLDHKRRICNKIEAAFEGNLAGKRIALLGLAFKKNTDDIRSSPALAVADFLYENNAKIVAYDPAAMSNAKNGHFSDMEIEYAANEYDAAINADAVVIMTEWDVFKNIDMRSLKESMSGDLLFDFRNLFQRKDMEKLGFRYYCVGR